MPSTVTRTKVKWLWHSLRSGTGGVPGRGSEAGGPGNGQFERDQEI